MDRLLGDEAAAFVPARGDDEEARTPASVTTSGGTTTVTGPDGSDTLTTVERLQFDDAVLKNREALVAKLNMVKALNLALQWDPNLLLQRSNVRSRRPHPLRPPVS